MKRWQTLLAIDFDRWAAETYRANFPGVDVRCGPVASFLDELPDADVILGGPPCQPFSTAGEGEGESDERDCIPDFIAAVGKVRPRMFLMENVPGLLTERHLRYFGRAVEALEGHGYAVRVKRLDAVSFGVPQFRERVWVWGIRRDLYDAGVRHQWPKPTHAWPPPEPCMFGAALLPGVTVGQALGLDGRLKGWRGAGMTERHGERPDQSTEEPSPPITAGSKGSGPRVLFMETGSKCRKDSNGTPRGPLVKGLDNPGFTIDSRGFDVHEYRWSDAMLQKHPPASPAPTVQAKWFKGGAEGLVEVEYDHGVADSLAPSPTLKAGGNIDANGKQGGGCPPILRDGLRVRRLTPDECLRLQSGPDDFVWPDKITKTAKYRVVGNGWACRMGAVFAEAFALADPRSRTVIDLFCGGGLGACGWHGRYWSFARPAPAAGGGEA